MAKRNAIVEALRIAKKVGRRGYADGGTPTDIDPITGQPNIKPETATGNSLNSVYDSLSTPSAAKQFSDSQLANSPSVSLGKSNSNPISNAFNNAVANPGATAINAAAGFIPGVGLVNSALGVANMFGANAPTIGSLATGAYGKSAAPTGIPSSIDLTTPSPSITAPTPDATFQQIADKEAAIGTGPFGSFTQSDVNAMANMMVGEAGVEGPKSMAAVGHVAGNRAASNYNGYGANIQSQLGRPGQFLGFQSKNANSVMSGQDPQSKALAAQAQATATGVLNGTIPSPVGAATDFNQSPTGAKGASNVQSIGAHTYFNAPPNVKGQMSRAQAVQNALSKNQQQQEQAAALADTSSGSSMADGPSPMASAANPPSDPTSSPPSAAAPSPADAPSAAPPTQTDPAAPEPAPATPDTPPAPAAPAAPAPTNVSEFSQLDFIDTPPSTPPTAPAAPIEDPKAPPEDALVSSLDMGPGFGLSLGLSPSTGVPAGTQVASLNPPTINDASQGQTISTAAYDALDAQNAQANNMLDSVNAGLGTPAAPDNTAPSPDNNAPAPDNNAPAPDNSAPDNSAPDGGPDGGPPGGPPGGPDGGPPGGPDGGDGDGGGDGGDGGGGGEKRGGYISGKHHHDSEMVKKALKVTERKKGGKVSAYPLKPDNEDRKHAGYKNDGGKMGWMSPDKFLDQSQKMQMDKSDKKAIKKFKKKMEKGKQLNPLALYPSGGQDGRHRATAAAKLGIKKVPVITWPEKSTGGSIVDRALVVTSKKAKASGDAR